MNAVQLPTKKVWFYPQFWTHDQAKLFPVLLYLEGMQSDPPDPDDRDTIPTQSPRSQLTNPARVSSPLLKGSTSGSARQGVRPARSGRSELSYVTDKRQNGGAADAKSAHREDLRSDIQEGRDSEVGTSVPIQNMNHVSGFGFRYAGCL